MDKIVENGAFSKGREEYHLENMRFPQARTLTSRFALLFIATGCLCRCAQQGGNYLAPVPIPIASDTWQYPLRLGDSKAKVHELLTAAKRPGAETEEYAASGVTILFDEDRRITKLTFAGPAYAIQQGASGSPILTERQILFGLTGHTDEAEFRRILGKPVKETPERSTNQKVLHCVWKKGGYIVDALFLGAESAREGVTLPGGSLVQIDVYRGL